jgi:NAD(P)-dependent dehydrogenase (short-subunit alcohol dehydrogenase family)
MRESANNDEAAERVGRSERLKMESQGSEVAMRSEGNGDRATVMGRGSTLAGTEGAGPRAVSFSGLRVGITGGTSGLGLELVREMARRSAAVAFVARNTDNVAKVACQERAHGIAGDISLKDDIHPIAMQMTGELGGLDVLINNASDLGPVPLELLGDTDCEDLDRALATNVLGPFRLTKALLGALAASAREGRGAVVVNISSDAAINPYPRWGAYGASKAALHHMTRIWNEELAAEGIEFLSLDPGDMDTPLHALAVPDANVETLKQPSQSAREVVDAISAALGRLASGRLVINGESVGAVGKGIAK